jgi:hypothetical protein
MTTFRKKIYVALILLFFIYSDLPVFGLSLSSVTNGVSSSENYNLDTSTSLQETQVLSDNTIRQRSRISGSGKNSYDQHASGADYIAANSAASSGPFTASTITVASNNGALKSQDVSGSGDLGASVSGITESTSSDQKAVVLNGNIETSQSVAADHGISISGQSTTMAGDAGVLEGSSESTKNHMYTLGWFSGSGYANMDLTAVAGDEARVYGAASMMGSDQSLGILGSKDVLAMATDGLYVDGNGNLGRYGLETSNIVKTSASSAQSTAGYKLTGYRWTNNPQIHIVLAGSTVPSYLKSSTDTAAQVAAIEISKATSQWDTNTNQNLFRGVDTNVLPDSQNAVEVSSYVPSWSKRGYTDGKNVHAWTTSLSSPIIAETITWYYTSRYVKGYDGKSYKRAIESDCLYNKNMNWVTEPAETTATSSNFDVRTIATHELGHTIGLSDLYNGADSSQMMYGYNSGNVKWLLNGGDKLGLLRLYGP